MTPKLLDYLSDPASGEELKLENPEYDSKGNIISGVLKTEIGASYPIKNGIPRFITDQKLKETVTSFGDEWNHFNFTDFKINWLKHTVANTFGSTEAFRGKMIVDAGGGSGAQTLWMLESGADHVIMMDLSHSVDDVVLENLNPSGFTNYDVIQCSIDMPPLKPRSIPGIVICHNVIQHTPSVEKTAKALFEIVAEGGEFVFNCYDLNDKGALRWIRFHLIQLPLRAVISRLPFSLILAYARLMGVIRMVPVLGIVLEKAGICIRGDIPDIPGEKTIALLKRKYKAAVLNTFDGFGSHKYQHHKRIEEIVDLVTSLQSDKTKIHNLEAYCRRPKPIGCALRVNR